MRRTEVTVSIGGAAGDGIASAGETLARLSARHGLHVIAFNNYQSVIRGGHVWLQVRAGEEKILCSNDRLDVLIALNQETVDKDSTYVSPGGCVLFNSDRIKVKDEPARAGVRFMPFPVSRLAGQFSKSLIIQNMVLLGAVARLVDMEFPLLEELVGGRFGKKGAEIAQGNIKAAKAGYDYAGNTWGSLRYGLTYSKVRRMLMTGNQAIALGAVAAGCRFYSAYPMTPASSILHWMAAHASKLGLVVKQAEDEIAVLNMAIGAAHVGARAMCGTSGGGFALMTEAVGLAGMTETPVVIVDAQRGGPSTGLPTKTEQGDLFQLLGAGQGDYPKAILSPVSVEDCFYATVEAHNLAERYQVPVLLASDLYLSEHMETVEPGALDFSSAQIDRGDLARSNGGGAFKRYRFTESGVSPRAFPGQPGLMFVAASDEHDEDGTLISDVITNEEIRVRMMEKRMRKEEGLKTEMSPPQIVGDAEAEITLVGWGSTRGAIREAISLLAREGIRANNLQFRNLWPFPAAAAGNLLGKCRKTMVVENNYSGQLARLIRMETGIGMDERFLKFDGEPFYPSQIVSRVKEVI